ncbi:MAG: preprotein translocase subunit SecG [Alloprevotella sp.]|nr:preprotein translocase subunit SecG [Alloprevotella sp.]
MYTALVILAVIVAVLLTLIVLIQESKGGGLASGFSAGNSVVGVRKTTDLIEKATWTLAGALVLLSVLTVYTPKATESATNVVTTMKMNTPAPAQNPASPAATSAPAQAPAK